MLFEAEQERLAAEIVEQERLAAENTEQERLAAEKAARAKEMQPEKMQEQMRRVSGSRRGGSHIRYMSVSAVKPF